jgi:hypothetical protein
VLNTPTPLSIPAPGQNATLTFSGIAGQTPVLQASNVVLASNSPGAGVYVFAPDGSLFNENGFQAPGGVINLPTLTQTGTYTVYIDPGMFSFSAQLDLLSGVGATISANGSPATYSTTVPGENVYLNFTVPAGGGNLGFGLTGLSMSVPADLPYLLVHLYDSNNNFIGSAVCNSTGCSFPMPNLAAGAYSIVVIPGNSTVTFTGTLSSDVTGALTLGSTTTVNMPAAGQNGLFTFTANAGQTVNVQIGGLTTNPSGGLVDYAVYIPNDATPYLSFYSQGNGSITLPSLPSTGTYNLYINSEYGASVSEQIEPH